MKTRVGPRSLALRMATVSGIVGLVALIGAGALLLGLFRNHTERQYDEFQYDDIVHIRSALERDAAGNMFLTTPLESPIYDVPGSGWSWQVTQKGRVLVQSGSLAPGERLPAPSDVPGYFRGPDGVWLRGGAFSIETEAGEKVTLSLGLPRKVLTAEIAQFRTALASTLALLAVLLGVAVVLQLRLGLSPLNRLSGAIRQMRQGTPPPAPEDWPSEVAPLVGELGALADHNAALLTRAREQAADLAHGLKTPLTIIRNLANDAAPDLRHEIEKQTERMDNIIRHNLHRSASGATLGARTPVQPVVDDLFLVLDRPMQDRNLAAINAVPRGTLFYGDLADLDEMLGNILDNAVKWARRQVNVTAEPGSDPDRIVLIVDDDGSGIAAEDAERVLRRGIRLDETTSGQGIGLSIVAEIASRYRGTLSFRPGPTDGTQARLHLPGRLGPGRLGPGRLGAP